MKHNGRSIFFLLALAGLSCLVGCTAQVQTPVTSTPSQTPTALPTSPSPEPQAVLDDLRVRQAIAHCTNRAELIRTAYPWVEDTRPFEMESFLPTNHPLYAGNDPEFQHYPYDPEKGQALLDSVGWTLPDGADVRVNTMGDELRFTISTLDLQWYRMWIRVLVNQWLNCGIDLDVDYFMMYAFDLRTPVELGDFEVGSFSRSITSNLEITYDRYACESTPKSNKHDYGLDNYAGWCNPTADQALEEAKNTIETAGIQAAFHTTQIEYSRDVPGLPLFRRMKTNAASGELRNFIPLANDFYTWNAAEWEIPGRDEIVIGESFQLPDEVKTLDDLWGSYEIRALIEGLDFVERDRVYYPITMERFPTLENGGAEYQILPAKSGDWVYDKHGELVELDLGVRVFDAQGNDTLFVGDPILMKHLVVTYEFFENLTWSDGKPVTHEDYELAYKILCNDEAEPMYSFPGPCDYFTHVDFTSNHSYTVTYAAGYHEENYFLPPIGRQPAHRITEDGRRLADVPLEEWLSLDDVNMNPIGIGPYILQSWENGKQMTFKANPYYFGKPPVTPTIIIQFIPWEELIDYLLSGQVDVIDFWPSHSIDRALLQAQADGKVRLYFTPDTYYEQLDFRLTVK
jgi:ABC-type transport system substrate-binding protein